jgi:hypothetical protein
LPPQPPAWAQAVAAALQALAHGGFGDAQQRGHFARVLAFAVIEQQHVAAGFGDLVKRLGQLACVLVGDELLGGAVLR